MKTQNLRLAELAPVSPVENDAQPLIASQSFVKPLRRRFHLSNTTLSLFSYIPFPIEVNGFLPCERSNHAVCLRVLGRGFVAARMGSDVSHWISLARGSRVFSIIHGSIVSVGHGQGWDVPDPSEVALVGTDRSFLWVCSYDLIGRNRNFETDRSLSFLGRTWSQQNVSPSTVHATRDRCGRP